ncbi:hypothetical protein [Burkholderia gladioli]|uniref:hypothetical protein n=1 Tax=Burkholderia gladioli TaxID=28095 RepID=UPI0015E62E63|nr:hypothetical protein [Burkholderia gladioli]MBA1364067.1 hypothetical protein [Burkholderia gladioli]
MSYSTWSDNELLEYYNYTRHKRAFGNRTKIDYLKGCYAVLGSLGTFAIICEALDRVSSTSALIFFVCAPGIPIAVHLVIQEQRRERDFRELEAELQRRGHVV